MERISTALIVDDDDAFRTSLQAALRRRGVTARTAATAQEGLVALEDAPADLVVVDNRMPGGAGLDILDRYRSTRPQALIVMVSGFGDIPLAVDAVKRGADTLLTKPVDADALLLAASDLLSRPRTGPAAAAEPPLDLDTLEREAIATALRTTGGVIVRAARLLGIDRRTLQRKLRRLHAAPAAAQAE